MGTSASVPRPPDYFGSCNECRKEDDLWASPAGFGGCASCGLTYVDADGARCLQCGERAFDISRYFCKACYVTFNNISPGDKCELCGRWAELVKGRRMQVDNSEERLLYSPILTEAEQRMYFPDFPYPVMICESCAARAEKDELGYLSQDEEPVLFSAYEGKNIHERFSDRSAMSSLGVLIVRDVLEAAGYETRISGFEETHSHLKSLNRSPDRSESLVRLSSNPDLEVTDREKANVYRVEVKTTTLSPPNYRLEVGTATRLRNYYIDAFLLVYHIPSSRMFVHKIRDIDWNSLPLMEKGGKQYYQLQFAQDGNFLDLQQVFDKVTNEIIQQRLGMMRELFRRYYVGLELTRHFTSNSY